MITKTHIRKRVFIVAEIGNNHEGNTDRCIKLVKKAIRCGVDAIKLQTFIPKLYYSKEEKKRISRLNKFSLSKEGLIRVKEFCDSQNIIFFSTPFDVESAIFLNSIQNVFKISSGDNNFHELIDQIASFNKPIFISTGLADKKQIISVHERIIRKWKKTSDEKFLAFLHCVSCYPVSSSQANLRAIKTLRKVFKDLLIGYSDHCEGIQASIVAVALGAKIIEKHFTDDKNFSSFRDHKLSADPKEMTQLVRMIRKTEVLMGNGKLDPSVDEINTMNSMRRSLAAKKFLPKGSKISSDDLVWLRPGNGIIEKKKIIGKVLTKDLEEGKKFSLKDIN